jgi:hypothetical protein
VSGRGGRTQQRVASCGSRDKRTNARWNLEEGQRQLVMMTDAAGLLSYTARSQGCPDGLHERSAAEEKKGFLRGSFTLAATRYDEVPRHGPSMHRGQHSTTRHGTAHHSTVHHSTVHHSTVHHSTVHHSTVHHSTAHHSTARHIIAQHGTS